MFRSALVPLVAVVIGTTPLSAQGPAPDSGAGLSRSAEKSVGTARALAILPSAGHFYAGSPGRGLAFLGGMAGTLAIGTLAVAGGCVGDLMAYEETDCGNGAATATTVAVFGLWGWSIYDAGRTARRNNARSAATASMIIAPSRVATSSTRDAAAVRLGVRLATR